MARTITNLPVNLNAEIPSILLRTGEVVALVLAASVAVAERAIVVAVILVNVEVLAAAKV